MKAGTKFELNKVKSNDLFSRMDNTKLKHKKRKLAVDNRNGTHVIMAGAKAPPKRRTHTHRCYGHDTQCNVLVTLIICHTTRCWYLSTIGNLRHKYHAALDEEHRIVRERDCDEEDIDLMHVMYSVGTPPAHIGKIMEEVRKKKGQRGRFINKNIRNASDKHDDTMNFLKGVDKKWSTAKK